MNNPSSTHVQQDVQTALMQDRVTGDYGIEVLDNNGVITLTGVVPSREVSERAEAVARDIPGVQGVINQLELGTF
jgi:osmotically-inducible protein OsmY